MDLGLELEMKCIIYPIQHPSKSTSGVCPSRETKQKNLIAWPNEAEILFMILNFENTQKN